jgi:hypothetical protein
MEENVTDFIHAHEKTDRGLVSQIIHKLLLDGINIKSPRVQGYETAANMVGKYNGVQSQHSSRKQICQICAMCSSLIQHVASFNNVALAFSELYKDF